MCVYVPGAGAWSGACASAGAGAGATRCTGRAVPVWSLSCCMAVRSTV